jgi:hypothetical protein
MSDIIQNYDLSTISSDNLLSLLSTGKEEIIKFTRKNEEIKRKEKEIENLESDIRMVKENHSKNKIEIKTKTNYDILKEGCLSMIILTLLVVALPFCIEKNNLLVYIDGVSIILCFIIVGLIEKSKFKKCCKKYLNIATIDLQNYKTKLSDLQQQEENIINDFKAIQFIPERYCYEEALIEMVGYVQDKRASNWERCTDLYEEYVHRNKMEGLAAIRAEQAAIQTELARQTRNATRWAAGGAWASAAGIWRLNSKI